MSCINYNQENKSNSISSVLAIDSLYLKVSMGKRSFASKSSVERNYF